MLKLSRMEFRSALSAILKPFAAVITCILKGRLIISLLFMIICVFYCMAAGLSINIGNAEVESLPFSGSKSVIGPNSFWVYFQNYEWKV